MRITYTPALLATKMFALLWRILAIGLLFSREEAPTDGGVITKWRILNAFNHHTFKTFRN